VSGDFYFIRKANDKVVVAAVDCTGHGIPGAFMSMLGMSLLNEIVDKHEFTDAAGILHKLRENVKNALHQTGGKEDTTSDGMDCALCIIDFNNKNLDFAGANNPLIIIRNNELIEYHGDKMPIGVHVWEEKPYTNHTISLQNEDMLYMFSDGYYDQFGGEKGRKLFTKNFKAYLLEINKLPTDKQKEIIERKFDDWKGNYRQIDDVIVMGIRV
jgi:serine phosphatase RsbU (regulator of sigma subunit)